MNFCRDPSTEDDSAVDQPAAERVQKIRFATMKITYLSPSLSLSLSLDVDTRDACTSCCTLLEHRCSFLESVVDRLSSIERPVSLITIADNDVLDRSESIVGIDRVALACPGQAGSVRQP